MLTGIGPFDGAAGRWTKARRFEAAWDLIRQVSPAQSLQVSTYPIQHAQKAYDALDKGKALVTLLSYNDPVDEHRRMPQRCRI